MAGACHFAPPCLTFDDGSDLLVVAYCKAEGEIAPTRVTVTGALSSNECTVEVSLQGEAFAGQTLQLAALAPSEEPQLPARTEVTSGAGSCAEGVYVPGPGALLFEGCVFMDDASGSDGATAVTTTCQLAALREFTSSIGQSEVPCLPGLFECATAGAVCTPVLDDEGIEVATAGARLGACR